MARGQFQAFKIPTGSMENNLLVGDHLLVNKYVFGSTASEGERFLLPADKVSRGDIVVFKFPRAPERDFIKRIIGLPGETLEVRDKTVMIDGTVLDEPYLPEWMTSLAEGSFAIDGRDNFGPLPIPTGHYFVMGDNRDRSADSRFPAVEGGGIGLVPEKNLVGKALVSVFSTDGSANWLLPWTWFTAARWSRIGEGF